MFAHTTANFWRELIRHYTMLTEVDMVYILSYSGLSFKKPISHLRQSSMSHLNIFVKYKLFN
jgi:hypothetical protein